MTPQDQIKAVAELDGWTNIFPRGRTRELYGCNAGQRSHYEKIPPYLTSRDAIIAVIEKVIVGIFDFEGKFHKALYEIIERDGYKAKSFTLAMQVATASQLTEAMLRATGKWKE